jgi:hypothetical protein
MRALLVVIVLAAGALVSVARSGDGRATDSAAYRHYFGIGKQACQVSKPATVGGVTGWTGFTQVAVSVPRTASGEERRGLLAGCHAAMG